MSRRIGFHLKLAIAGGLLAAVTLSAPAMSDPIVLKGITPWVADYAYSRPIFILQEKVNEKLKDRVTVTYLGSSEVVPSLEQFDAVRDGVVDLAVAAGAYYRGQVPEAAASLGARKKPTELRTSGYYDLMRQVHEKHGVVYLANVAGGAGDAYRLYTNVPLEKADLTNLKMRVSPTYIPLVKGLNGIPVNIPPAEVYPALERSVVDGFGWTYLGIRDWGFPEVTRHVVHPPFYSADIALIVNANTWSKLPADIRESLEEIGKEIEAEMETYVADLNQQEDKALEAAGMSFLELPEAEAERFLQVAYDEHWKEVIAKSPETGPKLRQLSE